MELEFVTLDVFTSTPYEGNPLAVVKVPAQHKSHLSSSQKQTIAREFNLSETLYLHEKAEGKDEWAVDIYTTTSELPFAGHPTIGAACYVLKIEPKSEIDSGTILTKAGPVQITNANGGVAADIPHDVRIHKHTIDNLTDPDAGLSPVKEIALAERTAPIVSIVKGMTFLMIRLPSLEVLGRVEVPSRQLDFSQLLDEGWETSFVSHYYYVLNLDGRSSDEGVTRVRTRMVQTTMEDPATGSAACALGSFLALNGIGLGDGTIGRYEITQGVEMGRKSVIGIEVVVKEDGKLIESVKLSGEAVTVMVGKIRV